MTLPAKERTLGHIRGMVSKILLEYAGDGTTKRPRLTRLSIAEMIGTDKEAVHMSLKSLQDKEIIRLEHLRIVINKELLQKVAGVAGSIQSKGG